MLVHLTLLDASLTVDTDGGPLIDGPPIPCFRCGICCERWQPLISRDEADHLARYLAIPPERFWVEWTEPYPFDDERRLLRRTDAGCVFLTKVEGRAACTVHNHRPTVCRDWEAGLNQKECIQGLARFAATDGLIPLEVLYPEPADRAIVSALLRSDR